MSPASQGALEVERYIGSCLISSNVRAGLHGKQPAICRKQEQQQQQQPATIRGKSRGCYNGQSYPSLGSDQQCQYGSGGWTGAPLISMTSSPRRCNQRSSPSLGQQQQQQSCTEQQQQVSAGGHLQKSPLSRLAIHTQGAPLILAGRFYNRGKVHGNSGSGAANALCGNVAGNYVHNSANPSMTSNANGATRCSASRIAAQRPVEATQKKSPATTTTTTAATAAAAATMVASSKTDCPTSGVKENAGSSSIANIDSLSIASDESSGSNNSENSLPRIIKPRKRRKKDRKPPNNVVSGGVEVAKPEDSQRQQPPMCGAVAGEPAAGCGVGLTVKPYASTCYEPRMYEAAAPPPPLPPHLRNYRRPPIGHRESNVYVGCRTPSLQEAADIRQRYAHHRLHAQVKVLDDNRNVIAPMRGTVPPKNYHRHHHHHAAGIVNGNCNNGNNLPRRYVHEYGEAAASCEAAARDCLGACQCRYCDPSGLIWDVDRNGYSPFLTTPSPPASGVEYCRHYGQMPLFLTPSQPPPSLQQEQRVLDRLFDEHHARSHDDGRDATAATTGSGVMLRRSWSDPTSYFSYEEIAAPARDVGVIGDRGQPEAGKRRTLWRGDSIGAPVHPSPVGSAAGTNAVGGALSPPKGLEVSTEIITSPNGHRDLEIKFYSSPSPCAPAERDEDKSSCHAEEIDEDDDFSDIWSYHESKLQQDFRTLLQAEE